jgi:hypothetical protein
MRAISKAMVCLKIGFLLLCGLIASKLFLSGAYVKARSQATVGAALHGRPVLHCEIFVDL